jgi:hypothetical protein
MLRPAPASRSFEKHRAVLRLDEVFEEGPADHAERTRIRVLSA